MTIVMVEHELAIMDAFCDPVIVLAEGQVLAQGTMAELRAEGRSGGGLPCRLNSPPRARSFSATGVSAGYDGRAIVHGINVEATPGKVVSIVGPNGSGKSTLLKSLVGRRAGARRHGDGRRDRDHEPRAREGREARASATCPRSTTSSRR